MCIRNEKEENYQFKNYLVKKLIDDKIKKKEKKEKKYFEGKEKKPYHLVLKRGKRLLDGQNKEENKSRGMIN